MALLKEDGSLDIERINGLPLEEYMREMGLLTQKQVSEYVSKLPINESREPMRAVSVNYSMEEDGVDAMKFIRLMKGKWAKKP